MTPDWTDFGIELAPLATFTVASLALLAATCVWLLGRLDLVGPQGLAMPISPPQRPRASSRMRIAVVTSCLLMVSVGYSLWGTPSAWRTQPGADHAKARVAPSSAGAAALSPGLRVRIAQAQDAANQEPRNADAWARLARAQAEASNWPAAESALRAAVALKAQDPDLLTDLADVLAIAAGRQLQGEPLRLLAAALAADPQHVKALALTGIAAFEQGDHAQAIAHWNRALAHADAQSPIAVDLQAALPEARRRAAMAEAPATPGPVHPRM